VTVSSAEWRRASFRLKAPFQGMTFSELGLGTGVLQAVADAGYTQPTPIQAQAIPHVLAGRDVMGLAQTGTGKTASFTLPMIEMLSQGRAKARMPRSLILEPTRELAAQVAENFEIYGKHHKLSMALLIGGVSFTDQEKKLDRGVDVLIATPGRLLDLMERGRVMLTGVRILVVDEADRMLDMGFIPDVERICKMIPSEHQTLFFSATMPPEIRRLSDQFLRDPVNVAVSAPASTAVTVTQTLTVVDEMDKRAALRAAIRSEPVKNAIIFCNRKRDVDILYKSLLKHGFSVGALHGDMAQSSRMEILDRFKKNETQLLVASDVAARGLDIPDVSHVFNFDVPIHAEDYVHRIGRTGRAGREGSSLTIATPDDGKYVAAIEQLIGREIEKRAVEGFEVLPYAEGDGRRRRGRGARPSGDGKRERSGRPERRERPRRSEAPAQVETLEPAAAAPADEASRERRERRPRPERRQPEAAPVADIRQARRDEPRRDEGRRGGRDDRRRREDRDDGPPVVGLGDHVPAFLLRPVRAAR
jgi:superfamily II DNA/RNA helicase